MLDKRIERINELYHKSQTEGLTHEEKDEQVKLRQEYVKSFRKNVVDQLNNVTIKEPDGSFVVLRDKGITE
ncbi:MAG: DUF896 domain-containing protein [Oscillospiraceae bacterium]